MNKAKMTFRFDGEGREIRPKQQEAFGHPETQGEQPEAAQSLLDTTSRYRVVETAQEWGDPFTDHTGMGLAVFPGGREQRSRFPEREAGFEQRNEEYEERNERDVWYEDGGRHGDNGPVYDMTAETMGHSPYYSRPNRTSWWKVAGSLTGAIVTGALFGFVVLSLFNQEIELPLPGIGVPKQSDSGQSASLPAMGEISEEAGLPEENVPRISIRLPEQTYYFLQYGVFSTAQGVQLAQQELQASGIATARDTVDEKRVYAGVSTDREQSKLLSGQLKAAGVHLILHEISIPASADVEFTGEPEAVEGFMTQSAELVSMLSSASASLLTAAEPKTKSADELGQLGLRHQLWTESASAIRGKWSASQEPYASEMEKAINGAVEAMGEYNKSGAKTLLWEVQNEMMRFIMAEQSLVNGGV
ncbi:SPOR domain-containing protein [Paenibacillus macerans]|uniref:SPOR domain-containing protein n=1 Tax=Paenibacillus macerans TaxID=44252 RepID=UPI003D31EC3E